MDWKRLRDLVTKCHVAMFQAGLEQGRSEVASEYKKCALAELEEFIDECKAEAEKPAPSPAPVDDVIAKVCRNCKYIGIDWFKKQRVCQQRHKLVENEDQPCCNLFEPSLTAICEAANRKTLALETAMAAAGTTGTAETPAAPGPLKPKPVRCAECKHGKISVNEGTATCKKSGMVFEDYSKFVPCGEFEPKKKDEEPEEAKTCGDCKHMGACMATSSRELGQPPPEHAVCELFEAREEDDEPEEPEEDKRCGDCVRYNARNLWCEGHEIPVVASSGACPDYRKEGF